MSNVFRNVGNDYRMINTIINSDRNSGHVTICYNVQRTCRSLYVKRIVEIFQDVRMNCSFSIFSFSKWNIIPNLANVPTAMLHTDSFLLHFFFKEIRSDLRMSDNYY